MTASRFTVAALSAELAAGRTSSRTLVEEALARIADPAGEGTRAFLKVYADAARAEADHADRLRAAGVVRSAVDGLPVSVKDLFDVGGDVTRAGSRILADAPAAKADAPAVARLRAAGAIVIGRTNMVEFAFGGLGLNPHYGTPKNAFDRRTGRVPGGSSSGAGVAVADGMGVMGLGSDTRGSVRVPAAFNGVVGFKSTARRISRDGAFPLSYTLDSVGPIANSVACCAAYDAVLAANGAGPLQQWPVKGLRLLVPQSALLEDLDEHVARGFAAALSRLSAAGAQIVELAVPALDRSDVYFKGGGFAGAEAAAIHRPWVDRVGEYDSRVGKRIALGNQMSGADYVELGLIRATFIGAMEALLAPYDALLMPTVPCIAPTIAEVDASDDAYFRWNLRALRNCGLMNFLDACAVTLPCQPAGEAPVGLSVCGVAMSDRRTLAVAAAVERALA
jgi:aspartyl-tRNA(Asn)/glutamyl-tRNA(Gln) amidotransferase subunit A